MQGEISTHVEGRVDVDELDAALRLDILAQGAVLERGEDEFVVAPDEPIRPTLQLAAAGIQRDAQGGEEGIVLFAHLGAGLVHLLDDLEG